MGGAKFDTIIIGGGIAGLAAAGELCRNGVTVCLIEARGRLGGRVETIHHPAAQAPLELGAEFIHRPAPLLLELLKSAAIEPLPVGEDFLTRSSRGIEPSGRWELIGRVMQQAAKLQQDICFSEFLNTHLPALSENDRRDVTQFVEGFNAAPAGEVSAKALGAEHAEGGDETYDSLRIPGGCEKLVSILADEIKPPAGAILLATTAHEIHWCRGEVRVGAFEEKSGRTIQLEARRLICTVPPPLLCDRQKLRFIPEIDAVRTAAAQVGFGHAAKVLLLFESRWWREIPRFDGTPVGDFAFVSDRNRQVPVWWSSSPLESGLLVGWIGGPRATELAGASDERLIELALESIAALFGRTIEEIKPHLIYSHAKNWQRDPLTRGAYSYRRAGAAAAQQLLADPVEDTLYFAGDATEAGGVAGTMEGALMSGLRAAGQIGYKTAS